MNPKVKRKKVKIPGDSERIIARLEDPLLPRTSRNARAMSPNVAYSCGAIIHNNELVIPYAMPDVHSGIATVAVDELLGGMRLLS